MLADRPAEYEFESDILHLYGRIADLELRVKHLQDAVTSHEQIGVATGLLAQRLDCAPGQAWDLLVWLSQTTNVKVRGVAQVLTDAQAHRLSEADRDFAATLDDLLAHRPDVAPRRPRLAPAVGGAAAAGR